MPRHAIHLGTAWEPATAESPRWLRRFGRPTGIGAGDRLVLVCEGAVVPGVWQSAELNNGPLAWRDAGAGMLECDVTDLLADRNLLVVPAAAEHGSGARAALPEAWGRLSVVVVSD